MSKAKKRVVAIAAALTMALTMGAYSVGFDLGDGASANPDVEMLQLAADHEDGGSGG